ncbi:hypothetical protein CPB84DRAFT_1776391 [Gymnopilus junonius]|uniref:Uncharacterized protein n=1 Tax=Gymnopilus junonius TaxID=109634 RepID=A0A9P5NQS8_GYMJU|nr:hypothetical protein CPB84DRAFT_1776391 [Gymnopilus junonius]
MSDDYNVQVVTLRAKFKKILAHPPTDILSTIRTSHLGACSEALAASFLSSAQANPLSIDTLVQRAINHAIQRRISNDLNDYLVNALHETQLHIPKHKEISPTNTVLSSALFAGSIVRNRMFKSATICDFAEQGLQLPGATIEKKRQEVVAIGVCLMLLVAEKDGLEKVVLALEALKAKKIIKYPTGVELLERTIAIAKDKFAIITSAADAWRLLFP